MRSSIPIVMLAALCVGAGPCDLLEGMDGDAGVGCSEGACVDQLTVEVIRADNDPFLIGAYRFELDLPDGSSYSIDCFMAHEESGMECELGDLDVMFPLVEIGAERIWLIVLGAPQSVVVSIEYNGLIIGEREIVPVYEELFPEGEQCPACYVAEESMAVLPW
jgi:hypothetical protein